MSSHKRNARQLEEGGWFELSDDLWRQPGEIREKLRILADTNVPRSLVEDLRRNRVAVATAQELGVAHVDDTELLGLANKKRRVLLTKDADFWSDDKFPLNRVGGLIYLDTDHAEAGESMGSAAAFWWARSFGGGWKHAKARVTREGFYLKWISHEGRIVGYEIRVFNRRIYARETERH